MKIRLIFLSLPLALHAQTEPEVRRALPANAVDSYDNPAWMQRVLPAIPVTPSPTPTATPAPTPFVSPDMQPYRPTPRAEESPAPTPDEAGSIRIAPAAGDPAKSALELANSLYSRKMYDLAIPEYERFLISGTAEGRDSALFRLAECHRILGNVAAARAGYEKLTMEFTKGEFAGAGAYRLGEIVFAGGLYDASAIQFTTAATEAKDPEVRLTARYFAARSYDYLKKDDQAAAAYRDVVAADGKNPYRDHAQMGLANIELRAGRKAEGLAVLESLAGSKSELSSEAAVKAAALAAELGDGKKALAFFDQAATGSQEWKPVALIGAMRLRYQAADYPGVIKMGIPAVEAMPAEVRPEALQLLAASYRQSGNNLEARRTYDRLLKDFPDAAPAQDARLQRLISLYALNDKNLPAEVDSFLALSTDPKARTQASLLKAEALYKQGDYAGAGKVYEKVITKDLDPSLRADALYKLGWCLGATENHAAAVQVYSEFLDSYPSHALASQVLARRALAKQQNKAFDDAIADFDLLIQKSPGTPEHELALLQKALIYGQRQDYASMTKTFDELLEKFPKSAAAGQANFWLGWAAFEQKDYAGAIPKLEKARELDAAQYNERASLRIILAHYYLQDRAAVMKEADRYRGGNLPAEISLWLAAQSFEEGDYARVESLLTPLTSNPAIVPPEAWIQLAESRIRTGKFPSAQGAVDKYLDTARDPAGRARGLLASARIQSALKNYAAAQQLVDEALLLQPEGKLNAEARMASGDILLARADYDGAARAFMTVSVLTDDPQLTPRALQKAADAYRRANNSFEADRALAELKQRFPDFQKSAKGSKEKT